jgi:hypothetical protein
MFEQISRNNVNRWCADFLEILEAPVNIPSFGSQEPELTMPKPPLEPGEVRDAGIGAAAKRRLADDRLEGAVASAPFRLPGERTYRQ